MQTKTPHQIINDQSFAIAHLSKLHCVYMARFSNDASLITPLKKGQCLELLAKIRGYKTYASLKADQDLSWANQPFNLDVDFRKAINSLEMSGMASHTFGMLLYAVLEAHNRFNYLSVTFFDFVKSIPLVSNTRHIDPLSPLRSSGLTYYLTYVFPEFKWSLNDPKYGDASKLFFEKFLKIHFNELRITTSQNYASYQRKLPIHQLNDMTHILSCVIDSFDRINFTSTMYMTFEFIQILTEWIKFIESNILKGIVLDPYKFLDLKVVANIFDDWSPDLKEVLSSYADGLGHYHNYAVIDFFNSYTR